MILATFGAFADFDYRRLVEACGAELVEHDPVAGTIKVSGTADAIDRLSADLDYLPERVEQVRFPSTPWGPQ